MLRENRESHRRQGREVIEMRNYTTSTTRDGREMTGHKIQVNVDS